MTVEEPSFKRAVERGYLAALKRRREAHEFDGSNEKVHAELMAEALYAADRSNAGIKFAHLDGADELEERLMRALERSRPPGTSDSDPGSI